MLSVFQRGEDASRATEPGLGSAPTAGALHPDEKRAASFGSAAVLFDLESGAVLGAVLSDDRQASFTGAFSPDGRFLALRHGSGLYALELESFELKRLGEVPGKHGASRAFCFSPSGRFLVVANEATLVFHWDALVRVFWRSEQTVELHCLRDPQQVELARLGLDRFAEDGDSLDGGSYRTWLGRRLGLVKPRGA